MIPPEHVSHDHLNEQKDIPIDDSVFQKWTKHFKQIEQEHRDRGEEIKWVLVDGFLLYWEPVSRTLFCPKLGLKGGNCSKL